MCNGRSEELCFPKATGIYCGFLWRARETMRAWHTIQPFARLVKKGTLTVYSSRLFLSEYLIKLVVDFLLGLFYCLGFAFSDFFFFLCFLIFPIRRMARRAAQIPAAAAIITLLSSFSAAVMRNVPGFSMVNSR